MPLSHQKYNEFSTKLEKFCLDLGMTVFEPGSFKIFCYDANNPIWSAEFCGYPSAIVSFVEKIHKIWIYPKLTEYCGDKILLEGDIELSDNSNLYYYKKVIKNTIQKYKNYLVLNKLDKINKDFQ
jgi:hypothetical protein